MLASIFNFLWMIIVVVFFAAVAVCVVALFGYNKLRQMSEGVKEAWSNIGVTARKQVSLMNQLIDMCKGYADVEKLVVLKVSEDMSVTSLSEAHQQSSMIMSTVGGMAQRFPDLKSNEGYKRLMASAEATENQLEQQRERYNSAAKSYNVQRASIPHVFYAKMLGFSGAPYLDLDSKEPQDMGILKTIGGDDGERLNALLAGAGKNALSIGRDLSTRAVDQSRGLIGSAQTKITQMRTPEYTYLDAQRNPKGPVSSLQLAHLYESGEINDETPVMLVGENQWKPYKLSVIEAA